MKARRLSRWGLILLLSTLQTACVTNRITGRQQAMIVNDSHAAQQSHSVYQKVVEEARKQNRLDPDPQETQRVRSIAKPLIHEAATLRPESHGWPWDLHVIDSDEVNAWCMAGGKMAVYSGLLQKIQPTDDELAAVMGHEIAHALLSHQAEKISRAQIQQAGIGLGVLAGALMGYDLRGVAGLADSVATLGLQLPNSREAESEADNLGLRLAAQAGFDPRAAVTLWEKMVHHGGSRAPEWLSTHPNPESRIAAMKSQAEQLMPLYEARRKEARSDPTPTP